MLFVCYFGVFDCVISFVAVYLCDDLCDMFWIVVVLFVWDGCLLFVDVLCDLLLCEFVVSVVGDMLLLRLFVDDVFVVVVYVCGFVFDVCSWCLMVFVCFDVCWVGELIV